MLSLLASVPLVPSTLASDVRLSNFFLFIVYVSWISLPVSPTLPFPGLWRPVFTGFSLLVSQSGSRRLVVSGCPDIFLYSSPFICFLLWLVVTAVRMSSLCSHLFPIMFLLPFSPDLCICLTTHLSSIISLPQRWCLILLPVGLCACLPSFVSDHAWVFPFIFSPTGGVLFFFQHTLVCD